MWIFAEFGHCNEDENSAVSVTFKNVNYLRCATRKVEGGRFHLSSLKTDKKYLILENIVLFVYIYGLNSHFNCSLKSILKIKTS